MTTYEILIEEKKEQELLWKAKERYTKVSRGLRIAIGKLLIAQRKRMGASRSQMAATLKIHPQKLFQMERPDTQKCLYTVENAALTLDHMQKLKKLAPTKKKGRPRKHTT